jgi:two-component system NarL family response regulator
MIKKVMIAAQKHLISQGIALRILTETNLQLVFWENNVESLEQSYALHEPHCLMLCINFYQDQPGKNLRKFMTRYPDANVLVIAGRLERESLIEMMESKAKGFISPSHTDHEEMIEALRSVSNGRTYVCQQATEILLGGLFSREVKNLSCQSLSQREKEVIRYISDGCSSKEIAKLLTISPSTVEVHRRNIMRKLDIHKAAEITRYAIRSNLTAA